MDNPPKTPEKKDDKIIPFSEKGQRIRQLLIDIAMKAQDEEYNTIMKKKEAFEKKLMENYPDARKYHMFHVLIGSTLSESLVLTHDDFPDEDSVEKFVNGLVEKYE